MIRLPVQMFLLVAFCWNVGFSQSTIEDASNISCVERIQLLTTYPPLARQARIQGTVKAFVQLSANGAVERITVDSDIPRGEASLVVPLKDVLRTARFRPDCGGKIVSLVFLFEIVGKSAIYPKQSLSFGQPNKFWITTEQTTLQP